MKGDVFSCYEILGHKDNNDNDNGKGTYIKKIKRAHAGTLLVDCDPRTVRVIGNAGDKHVYAMINDARRCYKLEIRA